MILVFEDNPSIRAFYSAVMAGFARDFVIFESPRSYLSKPDVCPGNVECILSDNDMPGMSGIEFLREIRNGKFGQIPVDVPFTMITGSSDTAILQEAIWLGADVVEKPVSVAHLRQIVTPRPPPAVLLWPTLATSRKKRRVRMNDKLSR